MQSLITSYLLQSGECSLAGIGTLRVYKASATIDNENKQIFPPSEEVIFKKENTSASPALVKYIADKKSISLKEAENIYIDFCNECKQKIDAGEKVTLATIGSIQKGDDGKIYFEKENGYPFYKPVSVEEIYQPPTTEAKENEEESDLISENKFEEDHVLVRRSHWGWWAAILAAIALAAIFYQLKDRKFTSSSAGNQKHIITDSTSATYQVPNK
jgi:nucleoid DNA-binding protein